MKRMFDRSALVTHLIQEPANLLLEKCLGQVTCEAHAADRCQLNDNFGLPYAETWVPPDPLKFEGPKKYGAENPGCSDCAGCATNFLECSYDPLNRNGDEGSYCKNNKRVYGGFMTMEFARDLEIQTPQFQTTQENLAAYVSHKWNTPELLELWGKPICVLGAGNHDILLDNITTEDFVRNVRFMLTTMQPACGHLVWLGNTTNGRESEYPQTMRQMKSWDAAVKEMIESEPLLLGMSSFIDVIDASLTFPHADFIHMDDRWYSELGKWFIDFM